jgi:hypothetical protein
VTRRRRAGSCNQARQSLAYVNFPFLRCPLNDVELEPLRDPDVFRLVKRTVRRSQQNRRDSARGANRVLGLFDLIGCSLVGELRELWVIPGMVCKQAVSSDAGALSAPLGQPNPGAQFYRFVANITETPAYGNCHPECQFYVYSCIGWRLRRSCHRRTEEIGQFLPPER